MKLNRPAFPFLISHLLAFSWYSYHWMTHTEAPPLSSFPSRAAPSAPGSQLLLHQPSPSLRLRLRILLCNQEENLCAHGFPCSIPDTNVTFFFFFETHSYRTKIPEILIYGPVVHLGSGQYTEAEILSSIIEKLFCPLFCIASFLLPKCLLTNYDEARFVFMGVIYLFLIEELWKICVWSLNGYPKIKK